MQGIIIINKEKGYTSQDVVSKVKKILNIKKAGHTGTLDPLAEGVLPVLLGNYTKLSKYLIEHDKTYIATIKFGEKRDTGDSEGNIVQKVEIRAYTEEDIKCILDSFKGKSRQTPPMYSAIKINGKKLYEYAREGKKIDVPERNIEIYNINLIKYDKEQNELEFEVSCSKGTYIRTLCEDISTKLGTVGYMEKLVRTKVDRFTINNAVKLAELEMIKGNEQELNKRIITMENYFEYLPKIVLNSKKKNLFLNGVMLSQDCEDGIYNVYFDNNYIGIGTIKNHLLKRDVIELFE